MRCNAGQFNLFVRHGQRTCDLRRQPSHVTAPLAAYLIKRWCKTHTEVQVCQVLLHQHSPSCQILCCKALNLLVTHILPGSTSTAAEALAQQMGSASAELLASTVAFEDYPERSDMETCLQRIAASALAKRPA